MNHGVWLTKQLVYDAVTAVSELGTNALQHGLGLGKDLKCEYPATGCNPELRPT